MSGRTDRQRRQPRRDQDAPASRHAASGSGRLVLPGNVRFTPKADITAAQTNVRFVPILLQKSFWLVDQKISRP